MYSGSKTSTLHISGVTSNMNGYLYRCKLYSGVYLDSDPATLNVALPPGNAGVITGYDNFCQGNHSINYSVTSILNATTYIWTLPSGTTGSSTTNSILVNYNMNSLSGNITVRGINFCGQGDSSLLAINITPLPQKPIITQNGNSLVSSSNTGNRWYNLSSGIILSATSQTYTPTQTGDYYVIVIGNGCSSDTSNIIHFIYTGIDNSENNNSLIIYPNPVSNELTLEMIGNKEKVTFEIFNSIGQSIYKGNLIDKTTVQTSNFAPGVYVIKLNNGKVFEFKKIVKE